MAKTKEELKAYRRSYYQANKSKIIARSSKWGKENPEKLKAFQKKSRETHKERLKPILRERAKAYYWSNPERSRQYAVNRRESIREEFILEYGGTCACCGETEKAFLTLEHKNRDGKAHRDAVGHTVVQQLVDLRKRGWPKDNYEILCFNCNRATWELGLCPHRQQCLADIKEEQ